VLAEEHLAVPTGHGLCVEFAEGAIGEMKVI
jgi:hypothetical protein